VAIFIASRIGGLWLNVILSEEKNLSTYLQATIRDSSVARQRRTPQNDTIFSSFVVLISISMADSCHPSLQRHLGASPLSLLPSAPIADGLLDYPAGFSFTDIPAYPQLLRQSLHSSPLTPGLHKVLGALPEPVYASSRFLIAAARIAAKFKSLDHVRVIGSIPHSPCSQALRYQAGEGHHGISLISVTSSPGTRHIRLKVSKFGRHSVAY